ncbi:hypothetical protein [Burkholderia pseudomultivorans]|uniref:Uncharacterized protein n=2 Tax=Burkholderia pseudomultivorans TaxID=1207504 RepID=A0ABU2E1L2_9BURK|nr:hypothetical protein [Burkholderia pseudomultivorans]MDR8726624.1 hypothetical protein [Burkholderia pseudomultivorans]MDR8734387.1 hypothetical protein [Burkholderia pseudomultivorans]MDR8742357.1 hypothetical protein [Burkholderia pseudomultivorans]MDR8753544.1 hypothetical protein [Burkholderia pseudomultivorans]MDR8775645.1 hypothetical protein [Burkholderia pseudomultivorans]
MLYGISGFAIAMFLALVATIGLVVVVALLGLGRTIRANRLWKRSLVGFIVIAGIEAVMLAGNAAIEQLYERARVAWYTHHLTRPAVFDGATFPAGSTVVQSPDWPHAVTGGTVPPNTPLWGAAVSGDFASDSIDASVGKGTYLTEGTLARPASFEGIACAAGPFSHRAGQVSRDYQKKVVCTLASDFRAGDVVLPTGSHIEAIGTDATHVGTISGTLPREWSTFGVRCAKGAFDIDESARFTCVSAQRQHVAGYDLAADRKITVYRSPEGEPAVREGVLASTLKVDVMRIPADAWMYVPDDNDFANSAERVSSLALERHQYLEFRIPAGTALHVADEVLEGGGVTVQMNGMAANIEVAGKSDDQASRRYTLLFGAK